MKHLPLIFAMLLSLLSNSQAATNTAAVPLPVEHADVAMNMAQKKVREAAVKVASGGGHGSGSYIVHKGLHMVFTAQHVADGHIGSKYQVFKGKEMRVATLVWSSELTDMAVLYLPERFITADPMKWDPQKRIAEVGTDITYSGFPSSHKLMTFAGSVAGYAERHGAGKQIILNTYGWFGCSGSVVYNLKGEIIGILYGVDVEYHPDIQVQENMIWVAPIQQIKIENIVKRICSGVPYGTARACK